MTYSNHRFTVLSADDVALCRAHSEAIDDARESRALQRWADAVAPLVTPAMSVRAFEVGNHMPADLPTPPSYWDDLEHWLKTLAPAKPAAEQPEPAADVWHSEAPSVAGVYVTRWAGYPCTNRHWDGSLWSEGHSRANRDTDRQGESCRDEGAVEWLRLIEADKPAQQPAQKASTHSVCIEYHITSGIDRAIGEVQFGHPSKRTYPHHWLPCDESGWVTHVPTADAVCPVPDGIEHQVRWRDGCEKLGLDIFNWYEQEPGGHSSDIIAWRPIAQS